MSKKTNGSHIRQSPSRIVFQIFNYSLFAVLMLVCAYPLWYVFIFTISDPELTTATNVLLLPKGISATNIKNVLAINTVYSATLISVLRTVIGTGLTVLCCTVLGYVFTKEAMPARKFFYRMMIITMYVSGGMIPTYLVFKSYGLLNTFAVYILPALVSAYYVILIKTYIESIPQALEESAVIDGAGVVTILFRIIMPLSLPIIATIAIYAAVGQWNSWFDNHIYAFSNKKLTTLQYLLYNYLQEAEELARLMREGSEEVNAAEIITPRGIKMTVTFISIVPIMMVYPFLQRFFMKGIMVGAVKG